MSWAEVTKINSNISEPLNYLMWVQDLSIYGTKGYVYKDVNKLIELSAKSPSAVANDIAVAFLLEGVIQNGFNIGEYFKKIIPHTGTTFNNLNTMTAVINSSTAMTAIASSSTAMTAVANSSTAMTIVANSSTAMTIVANSSTAMTLVINSSTAMAAVANSSTAMTAIASSSTAMIIFMSNPLWFQFYSIKQLLYDKGSFHGNAKLINDSTTIQGNGSSYAARWELALDVTMIKKIKFKGRKTGGTCNISVIAGNKSLSVSYASVPIDFTNYELDISDIKGDTLIKFNMGYSDSTGGSNGHTEYKDIYFEMM